MLLMIPLLIAGCASKVKVEKAVSYKCGTQIISTEVLSDNSMIVKIDGINYVLTKVASNNGNRYDNLPSEISFREQNGEKFVTIKGIAYPMCQEMVK